MTDFKNGMHELKYGTVMFSRFELASLLLDPETHLVLSNKYYLNFSLFD